MKKYVFLAIVVGFAVLLVFLIASGNSQNASSRTSDSGSSSAQTSDDNTTAVPPATTQTANTPVTTLMPLSEAVENYSDTIASNVDVTATITQLLPQQSGITAAFGNTIMATDGAYTAAVHGIDVSDFQNLAVGDEVEIKGGYMQEPENNVVQIVRTGSVTVVSNQN